MFHFYVHIILVGFLFLGFPRVGISQILTDCRTLSTMVEDAGALGLSLKPEQRILDLTNYCPNVSVHLDWRNGYLTDMRLRLFPLEEDSKYSQVVLRFLERYLFSCLNLKRKSFRTARLVASGFCQVICIRAQLCNGSFRIEIGCEPVSWNIFIYPARRFLIV